jgi:protease-4
MYSFSLSRLTNYLKFAATLIFIVILLKPFISAFSKSISNFISPKARVGVISLNGGILHGSSYTHQLKEFFKDPSIKAIVLKIESPGGSAGASQAIYEEIKQYKKEYKKPIISFVENICASGAYYIAAATDHIVATPSAFIGSIGVYIAYPELKEFINQFKITFAITKTGEYKAIGNPLAEKASPEQKAFLQSLTNDTYQQFIQDVSSCRKQLTLNQAKEWAEGKIFTGRQAEKIGLIDEIGSFSALEAAIKKHAALETEEIEWIKYHKKQSLLMSLLGFDGEEDEDAEPGSSLAQSFCRTLINSIEKMAVIKT